MKKPKAPKKVALPRKPTRPTKPDEYIQYDKFTYDIPYMGESLASIINRIKIEYNDENLDIDFSLLIFSTDCSGWDEQDAIVIYNKPYKKLNPNYKRELTKYSKQFNAYKIKLANYNKKINSKVYQDYLKSVKEYETERVRYEIHLKRKEIEDIKKKFNLEE